MGPTCNPGNLKTTVKMKEQKDRQTAKAGKTETKTAVMQL